MDELACSTMSCGASGACDPWVGVCACDAEHWFDGTTCVARDACDPGARCVESCPIPQGPVMRQIAASETLTFRAEGYDVEVGASADIASLAPDRWHEGGDLVLGPWAGQRIRVFARVVASTCRSTTFTSVYDVTEAYPGPAGSAESTAIAAADIAIEGWASVVWDVTFGDAVDPQWTDATAALGPAEGTSVDVVSLGRGGSIVLGFDAPLEDRAGNDFAVYENSFLDTFLELARISVSSDGEHWVGFHTAALHAEPIGAYDQLEPSSVGQLAGSYRQGWGTPFDLAVLRQRDEVLTGLVDLGAITHVRIDDIIGDGRELDAFGRPIYDPYPTEGSAGFDLDGVAALHLQTP